MTTVRVMLMLAAVFLARAPSWRPVALALGGCTALDILAIELALPPRESLVLWLATPVASAWLARRVLAREREADMDCVVAGLTLALFVRCAPNPGAWWEALPLAARATAIAVQLLSAWIWWRSGRLGTTADTAVLCLLAGDLLSLLGPAGLVHGPWWVATSQAVVVAAGVTTLQVARRGWSIDPPVDRR